MHMATKRGFFDLPLELRQLIYDEILPSDRMLTLDSKCWSNEKSTEAVSEAHDQLEREIQDRASQICGLRIVISPDNWSVPSSERLQNVERVEIYIDHYDADDIAGSLGEMRQRLRELCRVMVNNEFRKFHVRFRDDGIKIVSPNEPTVFCPDSFWSERIMPDLFNDEFRLRRFKSRVPIVAYLMQGLLALSPCGHVSVSQ